ncbi:MAG: hypothetical protein ABSB40_09135 [Nitrososphaeria archaeon]|jgi:uncharacterized membrane protein HdeD (DUF308 family)
MSVTSLALRLVGVYFMVSGVFGVIFILSFFAERQIWYPFMQNSLLDTFLLLPFLVLLIFTVSRLTLFLIAVFFPFVGMLYVVLGYWLLLNGGRIAELHRPSHAP